MVQKKRSKNVRKGDERKNIGRKGRRTEEAGVDEKKVEM